MASFLLDWSPGEVLLLTLGLAVGYYLTSAFITWYRLREIPGPFLASFSYLWLANTAKSGQQFWIYRDMYKKYGPLIRVGPNELSTDDPEVIRKMNGARSSYGRDPVSTLIPHSYTYVSSIDRGTWGAWIIHAAGYS